MLKFLIRVYSIFTCYPTIDPLSIPSLAIHRQRLTGFHGAPAAICSPPERTVSSADASASRQLSIKVHVLVGA